LGSTRDGEGASRLKSKARRLIAEGKQIKKKKGKRIKLPRLKKDGKGTSENSSDLKKNPSGGDNE